MEAGEIAGLDPPANEIIQRTFEIIYNEGRWGGGSGPGSRPNVNIEYAAFISRFIERNNVRSVVDLGCGDWQFSRYINWEGISYLGVDVVPGLIQRNNQAFGSETVRFAVFPNLRDLPPADLLLSKDVMQHWPNSLVAEALPVLSAKFRYMLLTNDEEPAATLNQDIPIGGWRALDLRKPPFNRRAATVFSWYVQPVRKSTMLLLDR